MRLSLLLLACGVSAVPAVYRRQESTTLQPITTDLSAVSSLAASATSAASAALPSSMMSMSSSGSSAMSMSAMPSGSGAIPPLASASSVPLSINCPAGYMSGSYNITRELAASAQTISSQIGDFLNNTWMYNGTSAMANGYTGLAQVVGATRTMTVNAKDLTETLTYYSVDNTTGAFNQTWILSNGPQDFGGQAATLVSYVQQLNLAPSQSSSDNSTLEWNTVFCSGDTSLFTGFFMQLHEPPVDMLSNQTATEAVQSMSAQSVAAAATSAAAQSLASLAESASLAAVSLTQMPTSSMPQMQSSQPTVTVTVTSA